MVEFSGFSLINNRCVFWIEASSTVISLQTNYFWLHCRFVDCIKLIYSVLQQKTFPAFFNKEDDLLYKKEYSFGAKVIYRRVQLYLCRTITRKAYISILNSIPHNTTSQEEIKLPGPDSRNERIFIIECNGLAAEVHCTEETIQIPKFIPSLSECFGCIRCQKARVGTYTRPNNPLLKVIDFLTGLIERFSVPGSRRRQTDCQVCTGNQPVMWQCTDNVRVHGLPMLIRSFWQVELVAN